MTWPARIDRTLAGLTRLIFALAGLAAALVAATEWLWRQAVGANVLHPWLEPAALLSATAGFAALSLVLGPRPRRSEWSGRGGGLALLVLAGCFLIELLWLDLASARSAWHAGLSLQWPVATGFALLAAGLVRLPWARSLSAAVPEGRPEVLPGEEGLTGLGPPGLAIAASVAAVALAGGAEGISALPQFLWNVLAGPDFAAVLATAIATAILQAASRQGTLPEGGASPLAPVLAPFGVLTVLVALVTGVRLGELWAVGLLPALAVLAAAVVLLGRGVRAAAANLPAAALVVAFPVVAGVLLGYGRPVELAGLAVAAAAAVALWRRGWASLAGVLATGCDHAARAVGIVAAWMVTGVCLYAATGLLGLQASVANLAGGRVSGDVVAAAGVVAVLAALIRVVAAPVALLLALPLAMPWLAAGGLPVAGGAAILALAAALGALLASASSRPARVTGGLWLAGLVAALALAAAPGFMLRFAAELRFW